MTYVSSDPDRPPNIEVFYQEIDGVVGWWWWACFPGCLPDSGPFGPFETEQDATLDAQSGGN